MPGGRKRRKKRRKCGVGTGEDLMLTARYQQALEKTSTKGNEWPRQTEALT